MTLLIALGPLLPALPAGAADWQLGTRLRTELEVDTNPGLVTAPQPKQAGLALGGSIDASRRTESELTQLNAEATLRRELHGRDDRRADGHVSLDQTFSGETRSFALGLGADADSAQDAAFGSADVLLGDAARRSRHLSASAQQRLDERWTLQGSLSASSTGYAGGTARDFRERAASAQLSWLLDERSSASLTLARQAYRRDDGDDATDSTSLRLGWTRRVSERSTLSLSAGGWRSERRLRVTTLACPLPETFCLLGLIEPVAVPVDLAQRSSGGSGAAGADTALDERSSVALRWSRDLVSGGGGVQRSTAASAALQHAFTPQTDGTLRWTRTDARVQGEGTPRARLDTLALRLGHALSPDLSLGIGAEHKRAQNAAGRAAGTRLTITLETNGPRWP